MKKAIRILLSVILVLTLVPVNASAQTKPTKVYSQAIKSGNIVYCIAGSGIYGVNLKTNEIKKIVKHPGEYRYYRTMTKKGGYLYYIHGGTDVSAELFRVKTSGGKPKQLAGFSSKFTYVTKFMIKGKKIYYKEVNDSTGKRYTKVMKLNGKSKKSTGKKVKWKKLESNKTGYRVVEEDINLSDNNYYSTLNKYWLEIPSGKKYYLGERYDH